MILDEAEVCEKEDSEFEEICEIVEEGSTLEECSKPPPEVILKPLPPNLKYEFLDDDHRCAGDSEFRA